jgi:hypothetical protein
VPYFGTWPCWFPAYLQSCKYNPSIRWFFLTDCETPSVTPPNTQFIPTTLEGFGTLFKLRTGIDAVLDMAHKVCDLRPAYGLMFDDILAGFDFWGHCDIDLIWGNIEKFLATSALLQNYDILSPRKGKITGWFTLYRNSPKINHLFREDEKFALAVKKPRTIRYEEKRWTSLIRTEAKNKKLRVYWPKFMHPRQLPELVNEWYWERGAVFDCTDRGYWGRKREELFDYSDEMFGEVAYLDFRRWKKSLMTCDFGYQDDPERFYISYSHISAERRTPERRDL